METDTAPDLNILSDMIDAQSPEVRELFEYALGLVLLENGKAEIAEQRTIDARRWIIFRTAHGELFSVVKPEENDKRLTKLRAVAQECLVETDAMRIWRTD